MAGHRAFMIAVLVVYGGFLFPECAAGRASPPSLPPSSDPDKERCDGLITLFLGMAGIVLLISFYIFIAWVSFNRENQESGGITRRSGISAKELERIPERLYYAEVKELLVGKRAVECAVCLCDFEDNERLRLLPGCSHAFHRDCIDTWLSSHLTCPSCRADIVAALAASGKEEGGVDAGDSDSSLGSSEPRHEVVVVVDPAVVAAEQEDRKR